MSKCVNKRGPGKFEAIPHEEKCRRKKDNKEVLVIQQIIAARHFSWELETREYCTHFHER